MKQTAISFSRSIKHVFLCTTLILASLAGHCASEYEDLAHLKSLVESYVKENVPHESGDDITVSISKLDSLKLAKCHNEIMVSFSPEMIANQPGAVILKCDSVVNWNVYVPIQTRIMTKVLTVNRLISPGDIITENDLDTVTYDKNRLYDGYFREESDVVGLSAVRNIVSGTPLTRKNLKQVALIKKNQSVTLALTRGAIDIEMIGIAKTDGYKNGPVKVYNPSSKKIVDAIVVSKGRAEINW